MPRKAGKSLRQELAKAIWESGSKDPETIAAYLIEKGWRPAKPTITFINNPVTTEMLTEGVVSTGPTKRFPPVIHHRKMRGY